MKNNPGKILKLMAIILGAFGVLICVIITYIRFTSIYSSINSSMNSYFIPYNIFLFCIYIFCIVLLSAFLYGIGHIIELLQTMNLNISAFAEKEKYEDIHKPDEVTEPASQPVYDMPQIDKDSMWKRPDWEEH